jgi:uncharacterized repeat protein (TIGR03803 family)
MPFEEPALLRKISCLTLVFASCIFGYVRVAGAQTTSEQVLYSFDQGLGPGIYGSLVQAADGNFYGISLGEGNYSCSAPQGCGSFFRLTPSGSFTTLYSFCNPNTLPCPSGPVGGIVQGGDGNFYGATGSGGATGYGTIFKITPTGELTTLYSFCSQQNCTDGYDPGSGLIQGSDGNFYGTTLGPVFGTVFKITPSGTLTSLSLLPSYAQQDPGNNNSALVQASDGNFYGTTTNLGVAQGGSVYRITPSGTVSTIYSFGNTFDGVSPFATLVEGEDGLLYGTSYGGLITVAPGTYVNGDGVIFSVTTSGELTTLYTFTGGGDGSSTDSQGLSLASDGSFYGVANKGGPGGDGSFYQISASGNFKTLYDFCGQSGCPDGEDPSGIILQGSDGNFYGSTQIGGADDLGTLFKVSASPALPAPVQISLSSSTVSPGASVTATFQVLNAFSLTMQQCYAFSTYNGGAVTPLGKVTGTLTNNIYTGSATFTAGAQGTYNFALTCGGVESGFATLTVAGTPTTTAIVANRNPPTVGQQVMLTAQVRRTSGGGFATGQVKFQSGSTLLGNSTLNGSGVATFTASTNGLPPGSYPVTATYEGDSADAASTSPSLPVTLDQAPTSVTLTANPTSVTPPANVILTATVTRSASGATGTPTGTVTFSSGTVTLATVNVNGSGVAAYSASSSGVPAGEYPVVARYNGDASDAASTSAAVDVTVK